jgi:hypothetical protein
VRIDRSWGADVDGLGDGIENFGGIVEVLDGGVEAYLCSDLFPMALSKGRSTA